MTSEVLLVFKFHKTPKCLGECLFQMLCGKGRGGPQIHCRPGTDNAITMLHPALPPLLSPWAAQLHSDFILYLRLLQYYLTSMLQDLSLYSSLPHTNITWYYYHRFSCEPKLHNHQYESSSFQK